MEYKVGDWVVRLNTSHLGIKIGQVCQIYEINNTFTQPKLQGQNDPQGSHSPNNLRMANPEEIPGYVMPQENYGYLKKILKDLNIK